jgi:hypothetical protein
MPEFRFEVPTCPRCGAEVRAIVERLVCYALLQPADDGGHDYADETKLDWTLNTWKFRPTASACSWACATTSGRARLKSPRHPRMPRCRQLHPRRFSVADNYLLFAESLTDLTPDEEAWLADRLAGKNEATIDPDADDDDDLSGGFEFEFYGEQPGSRCLKLYAIEAGDPEAAACFVQEFLLRFRPQASFGLSWCASCSKMRDGEFGGGGVFVTAEHIEAWSSGEWRAARQRLFPTGLDATPPNA